MVKLKLASLFSQRDIRWKSKILGNNPAGSIYTIGDFGCTLTTVCVYLNAIGINIDVLTLNDKLKQNGGFPKGSGLFIFDSLKNTWPDVQLEYSSPKWTDAVPDSGINKIKDLLSQGKYVVAEIDFYPNTVVEDMHWVGIYGYDDTAGFLIFDPWTGLLVPLSVYGDPKRVLYSYKTYTKTLPLDNAEQLVCHPVGENDKLLYKSGAWDGICAYLEVTTDPKDTPLDTIKNIIGGIKSRVTDLTKLLDVANAEVANKDEQVGRLKGQVQQEQDLRNGATEALNKAINANKDMIGVYEGQLAQKQSLIDQYGKDKGALAIKNTQLKTQLANLKQDSISTLSINDLIKLLIAKLSPIGKK